MAKKPEFKEIGARIYVCTVCKNFRVEIPASVKRGEVKKRVAAHLAKHITQYHSDEDFSQAAARIVKQATKD